MGLQGHFERYLNSVMPITLQAANWAVIGEDADEYHIQYVNELRVSICDVCTGVIRSLEECNRYVALLPCLTD